MTGLEISAALCVLGIGGLFPFSSPGRKLRIRLQWYDIMNASKIKNSLNKTFKVKKVKLYDNENFDIIVKIPAGLTSDSLESIKRVLEYNLGGDIKFQWKKYLKRIIISVNKQPENKLEKLE